MFDDGFQDFLGANALFRRCQDAIFFGQPDDILDFLLHPLRVGTGQVDFVDDGNNRQVCFHRQVEVCQRLRLNPLGSIDNQQRAFARGQAA